MHDEKRSSDYKNLEKELKLLFLRLLVFTYPVLAEAGFVFDAPLLCVVEDDATVQKLYLELVPFKETESMVSLAALPKTINKNYEKANYGVHFFRYEKGRYTKINIERVMAECGSIRAGIENQQLTVIIATAANIVESLKCAGRIYFDGITSISYKEECTKALVFYFLEKEDEIMRNVRKNVSPAGDTNSVLEAFWIIFRQLIAGSSLAGMSILDSMYAGLMDEWETFENAETYVIMLYRAIRKGLHNLPNIHDRKRVDLKEEQDVEDAVFYDAAAYYFPDHILQDLCQDYMENIDYHFLKLKLAEAGVLVCEGSSRMYYTKQIELLTMGGRVIRKRRVKIRRNQLDSMDEFSLLEYWQMQGGEVHAD